MMETKPNYDNKLEGYMALTWVPNPKDIGIKPLFQLQDTISSVLNMQYCTDRYAFFPEVTAAGNIHYHSVIRLDDKIKFYKKYLPILRYHGYVCIKNKTIDSNWLDYISKDFDTNSQIYKLKSPIAGKKINKKWSLPFLHLGCEYNKDKFFEWFFS